MTTEHQDDQRRSGGFREAVNELSDATSTTPATPASSTRSTATRRAATGDPDPAADRHAYGDQAAVAQPGEARLDDPAGQTTPGAHYDAGADPAWTTPPRHATATRSPTTWRLGRHRFDDGAVDDRPGTDLRRRSPSHGQPVDQEQHLGEDQDPARRRGPRRHRRRRRRPRRVATPPRRARSSTAASCAATPSARGRTPTSTRAPRCATPVPRPTATSAQAPRCGTPVPRAPRVSGRARAGVGAGAAHHDSSADGDEERAALVTRDRAESYSARWDSVKGEFVDEPRRAVADATRWSASCSTSSRSCSSSSAPRSSRAWTPTRRPPRTCGSRCGATAASSTGCSRSDPEEGAEPS